MKKFYSILLAVILTFTLATSLGCSKTQGDVSIAYYSNGATIVQMMNAGQETIGLIPEPAATNLEKAFANKGKAIYRLDLQELYDSEKKAYPQAVLMIKKSVLTEGLYNELYSGITSSVVWAKENIASAVEAIGEGTTLSATTLTAKAIDGCKIYFETATQAKTSVKNYIDDIRSIEASSANVVSDDFFFNGTDVVENISKQTLTFAYPDGAPALAISKLINDKSALGTGKTIEYKMVASNAIGQQMATGAADVMLMPVNAATKLYDKTSDAYVCVAVVTHGNFYIMSTEEITVSDLKDKRIAVPNMGAVPDWTIQKVLLNNGYSISVIE